MSLRVDNVATILTDRLDDGWYTAREAVGAAWDINGEELTAVGAVLATAAAHRALEDLAAEGIVNRRSRDSGATEYSFGGEP